MQKPVGEIYQKIANVLVEMIAVNWERIFLYAEVREGSSKVFFYFIDKESNKLIYSENIVEEYNFDKVNHLELKDDLYSCFEELWNQSSNEEKWTNLTMTLSENGKFNIEYDYRDVTDENTYEMHVIWLYKNLGIKLEGEWEQEILESYLKKRKD